MKCVLFTPLLLLSLVASIDAQEDEYSHIVKTQQTEPKVVKLAAGQMLCPNPAKLESLCGDLNEMTKDPNPVGKNPYLYHRKILEASCVDSSIDSVEVRNAKIADMWNKLADQLVCSSRSFDIDKGDVIKYAVALQFDHFIYDVSKWKINLNRIDPADNRSLLDYVAFHMKRNEGNASGDKLASYYNRLKAAGAKHKSEL